MIEQPPPQSWERLPSESAQAYEAAKLYFEMGAQRSLDAVRQKVGKSSRLMARWSSRYNWVTRAQDYDQYQHKAQQDAEKKALLGEAEKWAKRRAALWEKMFHVGEQLTAKGEQVMRFPTEQQTIERDVEGRPTLVHIEPANYAPVDAYRFFNLGMKLMAMAAGIVPGNSPLDEVDLSSLTTDELNRWIALSESGQTTRPRKGSTDESEMDGSV